MQKILTFQIRRISSVKQIALYQPYIIVFTNQFIHYSSDTENNS